VKHFVIRNVLYTRDSGNF